MVQFRKSKKVGPFRFTLSKRGISTSAGAGPLRVSRGADGKYRRTVRIPGTGLSDTKVVGGSHSQQGQPAAGMLPGAGWYPDPAGGAGRKYWDGVAWHDAVPVHPGAERKSGATIKVVVAVAALILGLMAIGKLTESGDDADVASKTSTPAEPASAATPRPRPDDVVVDITARGSAIVPGLQFPPESTGTANSEGSAEIWQTPISSGALVELIGRQLPIGMPMGGLPWCAESTDPLTQQATWSWGGYPEPMTLVSVVPARGAVTLSHGTHPADTC